MVPFIYKYEYIVKIFGVGIFIIKCPFQTVFRLTNTSVVSLIINEVLKFSTQIKKNSVLSRKIFCSRYILINNFTRSLISYLYNYLEQLQLAQRKLTVGL